MALNETQETDREAKGKTKNLKDLAREATELVEKRAILDALSKNGGNITHAAKALGISRATLQNKMKAYGLRAQKSETTVKRLGFSIDMPSVNG